MEKYLFYIKRYSKCLSCETSVFPPMWDLTARGEIKNWDYNCTNLNLKGLSNAK